MDFEFSDAERGFAEEVEKFLDEHATPDVADVTRENMAQIVDTPERRAFMGKLARKGWLGMSWPVELGGQDKEGIYEYILNAALARRGAPQIGKATTATDSLICWSGLATGPTTAGTTPTTPRASGPTGR